MRALLMILAFGCATNFLTAAQATEAANTDTSKNHINKADGATVGAEEAGTGKKAMHKKKMGKHGSAVQNAADPVAPTRAGSGDSKDDSANK